MSNIRAYPSLAKMHNNKKGVDISPRDIVEIISGNVDVNNQLHFVEVKTNKEFDTFKEGVKTDTVVIYDDDNKEILESETYVKWLRGGIKAGFGY
jgi:hypothetical protein